MTDWESLYELASIIDIVITRITIGAAFAYFCMPFVKHRKHALTAGAVYCAVQTFLYFIPISTNISNFTAYGVSVLAGLFVLYAFDKERILQKIFLAVTFFSVRWLAMAVGNCLYIWTYKMCDVILRSHNTMAVQFRLFLFNITLNSIVDFALLFGISWLVGKAYKYRAEDMSVNEFVLMMLPSMSGLVGYAMLKFYEDNYKADTGYDMSEISNRFNLMCLFYYVVSLSTIVVIIVLYQSIKEKQREVRQNELLNGQIESMKHHIDRVERLYADIRGLRHDMGNHITTLEALYETGADETAGAYMKELKQKLWLSDFEIKSGNPVTDVILSERRQEAQEKGISFECDFHYPDSDNINAFDMSVILNNALDNAIRAAKYVADQGEQAQIKLYSYVRNDIYMIEMENSLQENETVDEENTNGHGYGLLNIQSVARKYCGDMLVERISGVFKLSVMLVK